MGNNRLGNISKSPTLYTSCVCFLFLVERCKGVNELSHVNSIVRIHGPQSSFYTVRCNNGYHLRHGERSYECKEGQWFPQFFCETKESLEIWATLHKHGKIFYALPKLFAMIDCGMRIENY